MRPLRLNALLAIVLVLALLPSPRPAFADEPQCVEALSDAEVAGRLQWMERLMGNAQKKARGWFWGWIAVHAAVGGGALALALTEDDPLRRDAFTIAAATAASSALLMASPPLSSTFLLRRFRKMPDGTLAERREKLARSAELLRRAAAQEERGRAWYRHAFTIAFAGGEAFFLGVRHPGHPWASIVSAALTLGMLEAEVATTPRGAFRAYGNYMHGSRPCMGPEMRVVPTPEPDDLDLELVPVAGGLGFRVSF